MIMSHVLSRSLSEPMSDAVRRRPSLSFGLRALPERRSGLRAPLERPATALSSITIRDGSDLGPSIDQVTS